MFRSILFFIFLMIVFFGYVMYSLETAKKDIDILDTPSYRGQQY